MNEKGIWPVLLPMLVGLMTPSLIIFCIQVTVGGYTIFDSIGDIASRQFAEGHNLFILAMLGLFPFLILSAHVGKIAKNDLRKAWIMMAFGLLGILALMIPGHVSIWYPLYGPGHASSTAVIGFIFIPFYCMLTMYLGLLIGWLLLKYMTIPQVCDEDSTDNHPNA